MSSASLACKFPYRVDREVSTKSPTQYILNVACNARKTTPLIIEKLNYGFKTD
jgi:hypothetical protein